QIADEYADQAVLMKALGFDMVLLLMQYRVPLMARFLSPITNKRTDRYGGSLENRARFPLMVADRIKHKCGKDFLIEASISGCEPFPGGYTLDDAIEYARMFAGHIDLLQIRAGDQDASHPTGFSPERTPCLYMAEAIKKSDAQIAVATIGGYLDLGICENIIATGKADFIAMARSWISNPDYGLKAYEGRGEDVVPCIRCNRCHISSSTDPLVSVCSVNPVWGMEHRIERMIVPPDGKKKVAVVGGGPGGMEAALVVASRGHQVVLYEKSDSLGGLLKTSNYPSFKWPLKAFKNHLVHKIEKSNIKVYLNTKATPEMLSKEKYDAIFAALGSEPIVPDIPGVIGSNVFFAKDVYGNEAILAERVVIIGGGETGVETGMYLAENGHQVTVLESGDMLASKSPPVHFYSMFHEAWEKLANFKYILNARGNGIGPGKVTYMDADNMEHTIEVGSIVIAVGMKPMDDLAMTFYGTGDRFFMVGDCCGAGNVQKTMRSAFSTGSMI
ncbi:MAG: FAD-dependent oxidoreductase, partial [Dehalococcoidia bacterium]